jgi:hypothetical protein
MLLFGNSSAEKDHRDCQLRMAVDQVSEGDGPAVGTLSTTPGTLLRIPHTDKDGRTGACSFSGRIVRRRSVSGSRCSEDGLLAIMNCTRSAWRACENPPRETSRSSYATLSKRLDRVQLYDGTHDEAMERKSITRNLTRC